MKKVIDRGKRSKALSEALVENISKNLQSFLEIRPVQKEFLFSHCLILEFYIKLFLILSPLITQ